MRIISGKYGSRRLITLPGDTTRPSSDKLKTALFSKIGPYFSGGKALDIFAGSGAVGLEMLSRGYDHVTFIEKDRKALEVIRKNITDLNASSDTTVISGDARTTLTKITHTFDLIFMDPPYAYTETLDIIINASKLLNKGGLLIVETATDTLFPDSVASLIKIDMRDYGIARLHYFEMQ